MFSCSFKFLGTWSIVTAFAITDDPPVWWNTGLFFATTPFEFPKFAKNIIGGLIIATDAVVPAVLR